MSDSETSKNVWDSIIDDLGERAYLKLKSELVMMIEDWERERKRLTDALEKIEGTESSVISGWSQCYGQCLIDIKRAFEIAGLPELKPCPFCGEAEDLSVRDQRYHGGAVEVAGKKFWRVECLPCDCRTGNNFDSDAESYGFPSGKEMAIAKWNRREV